MRSPLGVPPRFLPKGLLYPEGSAVGAGFVDGGANKRRVAPASAAPSSSDAPRAPVIVPAGMMPERPECAGDEPNARGRRTRSTGAELPADVLDASEIDGWVTETADKCQALSPYRGHYFARRARLLRA